jgi:hypothetical protein
MSIIYCFISEWKCWETVLLFQHYQNYTYGILWNLYCRIDIYYLPFHRWIQILKNIVFYNITQNNIFGFLWKLGSCIDVYSLLFHFWMEMLRNSVSFSTLPKLYGILRPIYTWVWFRIRLTHFSKYKNNYILQRGLAHCEITLWNRMCK